MDAVIDRKESLKQELKNTQDELQTCKDSHRYISDVITFLQEIIYIIGGL